MFETIFIEEKLVNEQRTKNILKRFPKSDQQIIRHFDDVFGKVKKPYLHKRESLNLFIAAKRGELVKVAPEAYGFSSEPHYYFFHQLNCIYECEYCYLQGYFNSPDIVLFSNYEEIGQRIQQIVKESPIGQKPWFHSGEFSDSLALSQLTGEWPYYFKLFKTLPSAFLEIRSKSVNVKPLLDLEAIPNIIVSFSLSPQAHTLEYDKKTPPFSKRLEAIKKLVAKGYNIGLHFDPLIYSDDFKEQYSNCIREVAEALPNSQCQYISTGVVRFTKDVYREFQSSYPRSKIHASTLEHSFDGKVRYPEKLRFAMMDFVKQQCIENGFSAEKVYLCMEESS